MIFFHNSLKGSMIYRKRGPRLAAWSHQIMVISVPLTFAILSVFQEAPSTGIVFHYKEVNCQLSWFWKDTWKSEVSAETSRQLKEEKIGWFSWNLKAKWFLRICFMSFDLIQLAVLVFFPLTAMWLLFLINCYILCFNKDSAFGVTQL